MYVRNSSINYGGLGKVWGLGYSQFGQPEPMCPTSGGPVREVVCSQLEPYETRVKGIADARANRGKGPWGVWKDMDPGQKQRYVQTWEAHVAQYVKRSKEHRAQHDAIAAKKAQATAPPAPAAAPTVAPKSTAPAVLKPAVSTPATTSAPKPTAPATIAPKTEAAASAQTIQQIKAKRNAGMRLTAQETIMLQQHQVLQQQLQAPVVAATPTSAANMVVRAPVVPTSTPSIIPKISGKAKMAIAAGIAALLFT